MSTKKLQKKYEERLMQVSLSVDAATGKKKAKFPKTWNIDTDFTDTWGSENSIALRTGQGLLVIDIDTKEIEHLQDDIKPIVKKYLNDLSLTTVVETTRGYHLYFDTGKLSNGTFKNNVAIRQHVDVRSEGGCVFVHSKAEGISYKQISSTTKTARLPDDLKKILTSSQKSTKTIEYTYSKDGLKLNTEKRTPNKALFDTVNRGEIHPVIKAAGMDIDDFSSGQIYVSFNRFAFILANEPSVDNEYVIPILDTLIEEVLGFDSESKLSQEYKAMSLGNMVWASEYVEPEDGFDDLTEKSVFNMNNFIDKFSMSDAQLDAMEDEEVSIMENVLFKGQICVLVARPNAGKTLLAKQWSKEIAKNGYKLLYVYEDADMKGYKEMAITAKEYGFNVLASFANIGTTANDILKNISKLAESDEDLSDVVIILDTLKKFTEVLDKKANKELFNTLRKVTVKGGSVLILAHANKYLSPEGNLIYEGTGDVLADVDAMYMMYDDGNKHAESERYATLEKEKDRAVSAVKELSYRFDLQTYTAEKLDEPLDTRKMLTQNLVYYSNKDKVEFVQQLISEGVTGMTPIT